MRKALAAGALSASLVAGGAAGALLFAPAISGAQTPTTQAPSTGQAPQGQPPADRSQWMTDALAPLVQDGTINQAQADAVTKAVPVAAVPASTPPPPPSASRATSCAPPCRAGRPSPRSPRPRASTRRR